MDKPEKVEIGQWWLVPWFETPIRVEAVDASQATSQYSARLTPSECAELLCASSCTYLGDGANPEPTGEMLNMLAEHAADVNGIPLSGCSPKMRQMWIASARSAVTGETGSTLPHLSRAMLSLYKILRKLGKW